MDALNKLNALVEKMALEGNKDEELLPVALRPAKTYSERDGQAMGVLVQVEWMGPVCQTRYQIGDNIALFE